MLEEIRQLRSELSAALSQNTAEAPAATTPERLASPFGCLSLADRSSSAAELMAPQETTTTFPAKLSLAPFRRTTTLLTSLPAGSVSSRST